jgi:hypothetical protein
MLEVFTLQVELIWGAYMRGPWVRVIEISEDSPLFELHYFIQRTIDFDNDHMFEFYAGRTWRNRKIEFGEPATPTEGSDCEEILLNQVYPLHGLKLYYLFDFGDNWVFEFKRRRKQKQKLAGINYPRVIEAHGSNPRQYGSGEVEY